MMKIILRWSPKHPIFFKDELLCGCQICQAVKNAKLTKEKSFFICISNHHIIGRGIYYKLHEPEQFSSLLGKIHTQSQVNQDHQVHIKSKIFSQQDLSLRLLFKQKCQKQYHCFLLLDCEDMLFFNSAFYDSLPNILWFWLLVGKHKGFKYQIKK